MPPFLLVIVLWTSLYAISTGLTYAGFSAFVLEAIGKGAAATKYNVFASLSNAPIYYMIFIDEWAHGKWSAFGMLIAEVIMAVLGITLFNINFLYSISKFIKSIHLNAIAALVGPARFIHSVLVNPV